MGIPSGTPAGSYRLDAFGIPGAIEVVAGQTVDVTFSFGDAFRMP